MQRLVANKAWLVLSAIVFALLPTQPTLSVPPKPKLGEGASAYWQGKSGWLVLADSENARCWMAAEKGTGEIVMVSYSAADDKFGLVVENKEIGSLSNGQIVELDIVFTKGGEFYRHITKIDFIFIDNGKRTLTAAGIDERFGDFIGYAEMMGLFWTKSNGQSVIVSAVNLGGSRDAISKLRECAFKQSGLNPNDPFLQ